MSVLARSIFLLLLFDNIYSSNITKENGRKGKYFFNLLGYFQAFKLAPNFGFQLTPIFYPQPIFVLPSINQQQSVNVQKGMSDENYQEMGDTLQMITPSYNHVKTTYIPQKFSTKPTESVSKTNKRETLLKENIHDETLKTDEDQFKTNEVSVIDFLRQVNLSAKKPGNKTTTAITSEKTSTQMTNEVTNATSTIEETTSATIGTEMVVSDNITAIYPDANYNNSAVTNLTLTTADLATTPPSETNTDETTESNIDTTLSGQNTTENQDTTTSNWGETTAQTPTASSGTWGPYPAAVHKIQGVETLSITTSMPQTNEDLTVPFQDDRWMRFAIPNTAYPNLRGFKPLAGLYYDGFLHRPF